MNLKVKKSIPKGYVQCGFIYLVLLSGQIRDGELVTDVQGLGVKMVGGGEVNVFTKGQCKRHLR